MRRILRLPPSPPAPIPHPIPDSSDTSRFCPISLGDWLALCQRTGVPYVPAERLATIQSSDWAAFDTPGEHQDRLLTAWRQVNDNLRPDHMIRFDFCAPIEVKFRLGSGMPDFHSDMTQLVLDDPRAYDILSEFPREEIPIWQRPWTAAAIIDDYPVEYRTFVRDGHILGISSYYPQRLLPRNDVHLDTVRDITLTLSQNVQPPFLWPNTYTKPAFFKRHSPDDVHFTADFLVDTQDKVLFLEGGPPHELGAHPCCFKQGNIQGIALANWNDKSQKDV